MKKIPSFLCFLCLFLLKHAHSQELTLKKGVITDSVKVTANETYSLFLPSDFDMDREWPVLVVCDMRGRGKQAVSMFKNSAENHGYVLVSSNNLQDTISVSQNILMTSRLLKSAGALIPFDKDRVYAAGQAAGARFACLLPSFIKEFKGVVSLGAPIPNYDLLSSKNRFHYIGIVGNEDFNYPDMRNAKSALNRLKFPNQLWVFEGGSTVASRSLY